MPVGELSIIMSTKQKAGCDLITQQGTRHASLNVEGKINISGFYKFSNSPQCFISSLRLVKEVRRAASAPRLPLGLGDLLHQQMHFMSRSYFNTP